MNCVHEMGQRDGGDRSVCRKGCQIWLKVFTFGGGICLHRIEPGRQIGRGTGDGTIHRVRMGGWWYGGCSSLGRRSADIGEVVHFASIIALLVVRLTVLLATVRAAITLMFTTTMPADVVLQFFVSAGLKLLI